MSTQASNNSHTFLSNYKQLVVKKNNQMHKVTRHHEGEQVELREGRNRPSRILELADTRYKITLLNMFK